MYGSITDVPGVKVGHYTDISSARGCTVIICEQGAVPGVDVRGSSPGTRETDLMRPMSQVEKVHAILLSGGSAFGLDAASGVMGYLEEHKIGYDTSAGKIPIVPAAVLFDLTIGNPKVRPGYTEGYQSCENASASEISEGCVGAGTGALVGHLFGPGRATKSGLGTASISITGDVVVAAIAAVNAFGDVIDSRNGQVLAGVRTEDGRSFGSTADYLKAGHRYIVDTGTNTTLGVVATNAVLTREQSNKIAQMAHDGIARAVNPCHTMLDGDIVFALSVGNEDCDINAIGTMAAEVMEKAIVRAVSRATRLCGIPASNDIIGYSNR
jgi:L-aminopeptidase/D-esterase-like protein